MKDIFVSYRRTDSSDVTGRIFDQMKMRFGEDRLFKDVDSIPLGEDFRTVISEAVGQCRVLLAIIGKDWLSVPGETGKRRIEDPDDYVHIEIATALKKRIPVVPILVEHSSMPRAIDLPEPLRDLAFRNGTPVRPDPDFHHDMDRLCSELAKHLLSRAATLPSRPWITNKDRRYLLWALGGLGALAVALMVWFGIPPGQPIRSNIPKGANPDLAASAVIGAPVPLRYWTKQLPDVSGAEAAHLFRNALGAWQAVVVTPIRSADSEAEANVIVVTSPEPIADAQVGPPTAGSPPLVIRFGSTQSWTPRTFEAASCRMLGHILGLTYTDTPGQIMSRNVTLETLPLVPQPEDVRRIRQIWKE